MPTERTLSIIKPDAVQKGFIGKILSCIEDSGLKIIGCKMLSLSKERAGEFYAVHKERPFYGELVDYMTSCPILLSVLEGENAINRYRELMGVTDPKKAAPGTIRACYGVDIQFNAVHGSDGPQTAITEVGFFFPELK